VGVLKVLEELRIPIDAIAGTSMGAVVGGLYASGMSPSDIERELTSIDWEDAFRDRPARSLLNYRRRAEDSDFLVQLPLGFREGRFHVPNGLIQGQKLSQMLRELTLPVADVSSFDQLPTPFRAMATDLETGAAVVIGEGDLASALRASLSAPGIFAPVERDGRMLVDGGVASNLPVDVARAMGVDRLIVVDVGLPLAGRDQLDSVTQVANQMVAILLRREAERQLATLGAADVLVTPELQDW
jgi:NTE family protein